MSDAYAALRPCDAPVVSVVVISYNGDKWLAKAVDSVLRQTLTGIELIVVEDGSRDNAQNICASFEDPRIRYVWRPNGGLSAARNTGAAAARAPYLAFLDCDDWWESTKLERQVELLKAAPDAVLAYSSAVQISENNETVRTLIASHSGDITERLVLSNCITGSASSAMVRRAAFVEVGGFSESVKFAEDWECWLRLCAGKMVVADATVQVNLLRRVNSHGKNTAALRASIREFLSRHFAASGEENSSLLRRSMANVEHVASLDFLEGGNPRDSLLCSLRALWYQPLALRHWRRLAIHAQPKKWR